MDSSDLMYITTKYGIICNAERSTFRKTYRSLLDELGFEAYYGRKLVWLKPHPVKKMILLLRIIVVKELEYRNARKGRELL